MEPNDKVDIKEEDLKEDDFSPEELADDSIDWKAKAAELKGIAKRRATQLKKLKAAADLAKEVANSVDKSANSKKPSSDSATSELDTADLAYLAAKGIEDDEDIAFVHKRMTKWDMTLRDVLKDEDVQEKLKSMKIEREVRAATPSATRRASSGQINNLEYWVAKYERTGEYPKDFDLRVAVVDAIANKSNPNQPSWRR